ncbi:unnamed protein product [Acanthoscelides obtectus]|uniref:WD repeat-containing protein 89 n=1 Tax=Acanthoscelides obtectus TaxID=200917 RepID=A0A9P0NVY8_ACAOB|nr:unnamed protein product [Acanthoscelides obtectus]CAK1679039.1 WD repeat-containing protein 89 [Acanthoscelides obtectus]
MMIDDLIIMPHGDSDNSQQNYSDSDPDDDNLDEFTSCTCSIEKHISSEYILHVTATNENHPTCVLGLSNYTCEVYTIGESGIAKVGALHTYEDKVIGCKFSTTDKNSLYTGSSDGSIHLWDMRVMKKPALLFKDTTLKDGSQMKPFTCFDISPNDRLLAVGTDLCGSDVFTLFWDVRKGDLLGGYWESHTDVITEVKFHPDDVNKLISGSVDGLINLYDLSQPCEDDAFMDSLNTNSSVDHLQWFKQGTKDCITCVTDVTSDLQLWDLDKADPYKHLSRKDLSKLIKKKKEDYIYLAGCHDSEGQLMVLVGSNYETGDCLRSLQIEKAIIKPHFEFKGNQQIVRSSSYNKNTNILLTGGENGILAIWRL